MASQASFYWHDYETWGVNPQLDRPCQFAGLRTSLDFEPIGRPLTLYCQPSPERLPHPQAVLVTGITPQTAHDRGTHEAAFAERIAAEFQQPETVIVGYNNIAFDDEVTRYLFYRNFYDPYAHTWQQHSSRWDLIDLVRACYALRPDGIEWPQHEDGRVSMKLEDLTRANGIDHGQAHDAMADVRATIALAKLLKTAQPKLFDYGFSIRTKQAVKKLIDLIHFTPLVHVQGYYGAAAGYLSMIVPLGYHSQQPNQLLYWDLRCDPEAFLDVSSEAMHERRFTRKSEREQAQLTEFGGRSLAINKAPFIADPRVLDTQQAQRFELDLSQLNARAKWLQENPDFRQRVIDALEFEHPRASTENVTDPDLMLYSGPFFSDQDRANMEIIRNTPAEQLAALELNFEDERLPEMLFRYRARNYPATLTDQELRRWQQHCQQQLIDPPGNALTIEQFLQQIQQLSEQYQDQAKPLRLLNDLYRYVENL